MYRMRLNTLPIAALLVLLAGVAHAYTLTGTVVDTSRRPIADAKVWLSQERVVRTAQTDEAGYFTFGEVGLGSMELVAWKDGYAYGGEEGLILDDREIVVPLGEPGAMHVRVIDPEFKPLWGARVYHLYINDAYNVAVEDLVPHGFPSPRSDEQGMLEIANLPKNGVSSFSVGHRNYAAERMPSLPVGSKLDLRLPFGVDVRGRVSADDGTGIARARLSFFRPTGVGSLIEFTEVLTDEEGFYVAKLPESSYYAIPKHPDYAMPQPKPFQVDDGQESAIVDLVMPPPYEIRGDVVGPKGEPVPATKIAYIAEAFHGAKAIYEETHTGADGRFSLTVAGGRGTVRVSPPPRMATVAYPDIPFELLEQQVTTLPTIELRALPDAKGVVDARGETDLDRVLISTLNVEPPRWTIADAEGRFTLPLEKMPEKGKVELRAEHAFRFLRREFDIDVTKDKVEDVRLRSFQPDLAEASEHVPNKMKHMVGDFAPEWSCDAWFNLPDGKESLSLADLRGKVVVMTLWGGFAKTGAARNRMEELRALHTLYRGDDEVAFVAIHEASTEPPDVDVYVHEFGLEFPVGCDADPVLTFDAYNTNVIPQTVLIDKEGKLRHFDVDGRLLELIKDLRRR